MALITSREDWLQKAAAPLCDLICQHGGQAFLPSLEVSCSWPSRGGLPSGLGGHVIGECWHSSGQTVTGGSGKAHIFVSPLIAETVDVLAVLAHEICHASLPMGTGHGKAFADLCKAIGLDGPATATVPGEQFKVWCQAIIGLLGEYPHKPVTFGGIVIPPILPGSPKRKCGGEIAEKPKKQATRLNKCACQECGYTVRVTRKWLDLAGPPLCPQHPKSSMVEDAGDGPDAPKSKPATEGKEAGE